MARGNRPSRTTTMAVQREEIRMTEYEKHKKENDEKKEVEAEISPLRNDWICKCPYWRKIRLSYWTPHADFANH